MTFSDFLRGLAWVYPVFVNFVVQSFRRPKDATNGNAAMKSANVDSVAAMPLIQNTPSDPPLRIID